MNLEPYLQRIRSEFPELTFHNVTVPAQGMDHIALIIDDAWVFRFPKLPEYVANFPNEVRLLSELQAHVQLPIPQYKYIASDASFGAYPMIRGQQLWPRTFQGLSDNVRVIIAEELAAFLTQLHAFPVDRATALGVQRQDPVVDLRALEEEYERWTRARLTIAEQASCAVLFTSLRACMEDQHPQVLTHSDLLSEHILLREQHDRLAGIIDFGDKAIADPAIDFAGLWDFSWDFATAVFERYGGPKSKTLLHRSFLYFQQMSVRWLNTEAKGEYWGYDETYRHFREAMAMQSP